jgi:hypothetical protein
MSQLITTQFVQQFSTNVQLLLQQKGSRLRGSVREGMHVGEQPCRSIRSARSKRPSAVRATPTSPGRHADRPSLGVPVRLRLERPDRQRGQAADARRSAVAYVINGTYAMGRAMDNEIIPAFFGTAKTGKAGGTSTTFPAAQQIAVSFGAAAAIGLTIAKLREAKRLLLAAEVDVDNDPLFVPITAKQHDNLLGEAQAISLDYNTKPVLVEGKITSFMGFNFIHTELLQLNGSGFRRVPAYAQSGMYLGLWNDIRTDVSSARTRAACRGRCTCTAPSARPVWKRRRRSRSLLRRPKRNLT